MSHCEKKAWTGSDMAGEEVTGLRVAAAVPPGGEDHVGHGESAESPEDDAHHGFIESGGGSEGEPGEGAEDDGGGGEGKAFEQEPAAGARGGVRKTRGAEVGDVADGVDEAEIEKKGGERMEDGEDGGGEEEFGDGGKPARGTLP